MLAGAYPERTGSVRLGRADLPEPRLPLPPSRDVAGDLAGFTDGLDGRLVFAIEAFQTRVAMVELTEGPPPVLPAATSRASRRC